MIDGSEDTFPKLLLRNYKVWGDEVAVYKKDYGIWREYTWRDCYQKIKWISLGLVSLGFVRGDRIAIIGDNTPEWYWIAIAGQVCRGLVAGIFSDAISSEVKYIANNSGAKFIAAHDQEQVDKILEIKDELPMLRKVIYWSPKGMRSYHDELLISIDELMRLGREYEELHPEWFEAEIAEGRGDDIYGIYYTSGTTGVQKGALLSYDIVMNSIEGLLSKYPLEKHDHYLSTAPAPWIGETISGIGPHLIKGVKVSFAESPETVREDMREVAPQLVGMAPSQIEGIASMVQVRINEAGFIKRGLYNLFLPVGYKLANYHINKKKPGILWRILHTIAFWLVFRPLLDKLGLLKTKLAFCGGAFMAPVTFDFLLAIGVKLVPVYGATEVGGFSTCPGPDDIKYGEQGIPLPGVELRISDEGEILISGDFRFSGYYGDAEKTRKNMIGRWFRTGDAGNILDDGQIVFYDRIKDIKELANGAKYSPQYIEANLRFSPYIQNAIALGEGKQDCVSVIIDIDIESLGQWAEQRQISYTTYEDLAQREEVANLILSDVKRVNRYLPESSKIKKYVLLQKALDADEAEITRTRKIRRDFLQEKYRTLIDAIYRNEEEVTAQTEVQYRDGRMRMKESTYRIWTVP